MNIVAIVQARTTSSRLYRKVLLPILNTPMILFQLKRVSRCKLIDELILATSSEQSDDELSEIVTNSGYTVFRGELNDVLARYAECSRLKKADIVVRLTGDCPFSDPYLIDEIILEFKKGNWDYLGNAIDADRLSVPDGFDIEVFTAKILKTANEQAYLPSHREHVTPWMRSNISNARWAHYVHQPIRKYFRVTVDDEKDYEVIQKIANALSQKKKHFDIDDIVNFLSENKNIADINKDTIRNMGLIKSIEEDLLYQKKNTSE